MITIIRHISFLDSFPFLLGGSFGTSSSLLSFFLLGKFKNFNFSYTLHPFSPILTHHFKNSFLCLSFFFFHSGTPPQKWRKIFVFCAFEIHAYWVITLSGVFHIAHTNRALRVMSCHMHHIELSITSSRIKSFHIELSHFMSPWLHWVTLWVNSYIWNAPLVPLAKFDFFKIKIIISPTTFQRNGIVMELSPGKFLWIGLSRFLIQQCFPRLDCLLYLAIFPRLDCRSPSSWWQSFPKRIVYYSNAGKFPGMVVIYFSFSARILSMDCHSTGGQIF